MSIPTSSHLALFIKMLDIVEIERHERYLSAVVSNGGGSLWSDGGVAQLLERSPSIEVKYSEYCTWIDINTRLNTVLTFQKIPTMKLVQ